MTKPKDYKVKVKALSKSSKINNIVQSRTFIKEKFIGTTFFSIYSLLLFKC